MPDLTSKILIESNPLYGSKIIRAGDGTISGVDYLADSTGIILQDVTGIYLQSAD